MIVRTLTVFAVVAMGACDDGSGPPPSPVPVAEVAVTADSASITIESKTSLHATLRNGNLLLGDRAIAWINSAPGIVALTSSGDSASVTALAPGKATITAASEGVTGAIEIVVKDFVVGEVTVTIDSATLGQGNSATATAVLRNGTRILTGRAITWSSSAPTVAGVTGTGNTAIVTGLRPGTATIFATSEGVTNSVTFQIVNRYSAEVRQDAPVAYWRFEETAGTVAADSSGLERDGTYIFGPALGSDVGAHLGRAVAFGNSLDGMTVNGGWSNAQTITVEAWVKPAEVFSVEGTMIVDKGGSWNLIINSDGTPAFHLPGLNESQARSPEPLQAGATYHLVGVFGNGSMKLYVDGELVAQATPPGPLEGQPNTPVSVGRGLSDGRFEFVGVIDEVAIYDKVLSADAVLRHFTRGKP